MSSKVIQIFIIANMILNAQISFAEDFSSPQFKDLTPNQIEHLKKIDEHKLKFSQVITEILPTSEKTFNAAFAPGTLNGWLTILGTTGVLYYYDEQILGSFQRNGRDWGLGNGDKTKAFVTAFGQDILRLPTDKGSALYFLGDGWTHMSIAASFLARGALTGGARPFNTGLQLVHGMFVSTLFNQSLKRSFGREDPNFSTRERGAWRPFPSFSEYNSNVARYDAMPSGHIMTATLTFTILYTNYPELAGWILPVGGVWLSALAFQMVNNGVHWASDYPLGIAMGYVIGKMATTMGEPIKKDDEKKEPELVFFPAISQDGYTLNGIYQF